MAHFVRVIKASSLRSKWFRLISEKQAGLSSDELEYSDDWSDREDFGDRFKNKLVNSSLGRYIVRVGSETSFENVMWKSLLGFLGGVLLSYLFFFFFYVGMNMSLRNVTYLCSVTGIALCLGLAFSTNVRCYVFLLLPVFFSKQGRQALIAYALFLAFTGPGKNTMHNMGILSESMTCGQQMNKKTLKQLIDMVKAPYRSVKETIKKLTEAVQNVVEIIKDFVTKTSRLIIIILSVMREATTWLGSIVNLCNKKVGTPFQRCMKTFDDAIIDCKAKLGIMDFMCHVVHVIKGLCYTVKWLDFICLFSDFVTEQVIAKVRKKLREFSLHMKNLLYVSVEFSHSYAIETTETNTTKEVAKTILQKISEKVERVQTIFGLFGFLFGFLFLFVFFKVYNYKYKYLSSDRYDNYYISNYIIELDLKRAQLDRETVLPLEPREKKIYARPTALRLLKAEKIRMGQSVFLLTLTSFKIISFLVCDYSLYWVLRTIYEAGREEDDQVEKPKVVVHVKGKGVIAHFYEKLGKSFEVPENPYVHENPLHCLPDPVKPGTGRYIQIGFLLGLSWLLALLEPYGLRLRNIVMSHYYPDRARERAVYLYNHILRSRGSFVRFARRHLRRRFPGYERVRKITFFQRLFASFPILGAIFGKPKDNACILCGTLETEEEPLKRCKTPECKGRYCLRCYTTIQNICTICQHPIDYGDISDISEEVDSSDEDFYRSEETTHSSDQSEERFMTFQDLERRERFRDVEANRKIDYVKLGDLYSDKEALHRRLREALINRINTLEEEKEQEKRSRMQQITTKLRDVIERLKKKKTEDPQGLKSALRKNLRARSDLGPLKPEENMVDEEKPSKVSFQLNPEVKLFNKEYAGSKDELVEEIKMKIQNILQSKNLKREVPVEKLIIADPDKGSVHSSESSEKSSPSSEKSSSSSGKSKKKSSSSSSRSSRGSGKSVGRTVRRDSPPRRSANSNKKKKLETLAYYFVEKEKKRNFPLDKISDIKFEGPRRRNITQRNYYF